MATSSILKNSQIRQHVSSILDKNIQKPDVLILGGHGQIFAPCNICIPHVPVGYGNAQYSQK